MAAHAGGAYVKVWSCDWVCMTQERRERHRQNYMHVTIHTSQTWADTFISELNDTHVEAELRTKHIPPQARGRMTLASCQAERAVSGRQDWVQPSCQSMTEVRVASHAWEGQPRAGLLQGSEPCVWRHSRMSLPSVPLAGVRRWASVKAVGSVPPPASSLLKDPTDHGNKGCDGCCAAQLDAEEVVAQYGAAQRRLLVLGYNATLTTAVEAPRAPKRHFDQIRVRAPVAAVQGFSVQGV